MSIQAYLEGLPLPLYAGFSVKRGDDVVRTEMESGTARQRRRFTSTPTEIPVRWLLEPKEYELFEGWYEHQLNGGTDWFQIQLLTGIGLGNQVVRFIKVPVVKVVSGGFAWAVSATLESRDLKIIERGAFFRAKQDVDGFLNG